MPSAARRNRAPPTVAREPRPMNFTLSATRLRRNGVSRPHWGHGRTSGPRHLEPARFWCNTARVPRVAETRRVRLPVRKDGCFRLAVVADTHSKPHPATGQRLRELAPDAILHAGDIGDLDVLDRLAEVAPVFAVRGNIDVLASDVPERLVLDVVEGDARKLVIL